MFRSVLVPLDGSSTAAQAIPYAARIAAPGARIALVCVVEPPVNELFNISRSAQVAEQMDFSREILSREAAVQAERLRDQGFQVITALPSGSATDEIISCAHIVHADAIAMTTHGTGGVAHWLLGSVTSRVLHATHIPVLVARAATAMCPTDRVEIESIIVPLDGSAIAEQARDVACDLAKQLALPLRIVRVVDDKSSLLHAASIDDYAAARWLVEALASARTRAGAYVGGVTARSRAAGLDAVGTVLVGSPAATLVQHFGEHPNALVVMATNGEGGAQQWAFGSVAEKIITTAPNPTLVLRPATRNAQAPVVARPASLLV